MGTPWWFTRINPAAWVFAGLFVVEAALLFAAAGGGIEYFSADGPIPVLGVVSVIYAFAYPFVTQLLGHRYAFMPTFGVPVPPRY